MPTFEEKIQKLADKYRRQMRVVAQEAVQTTVSIAQRIDEEGGRMRVDTGFLRASCLAAFNGMPSGESVNSTPPGTVVNRPYDGAVVQAVLLQWDMQDTLYIGWTANYARAREYRDRFMRGATEQWQNTVDKTVVRVKAAG